MNTAGFIRDSQRRVLSPQRRAEKVLVEFGAGGGLLFTILLGELLGNHKFLFSKLKLELGMVVMPIIQGTQ
jgi:SAM-dependent MidA family methyltransferase